MQKIRGKRLSGATRTPIDRHPGYLRLLPRLGRRAALDGRIVAAAQEERFSRIKHDAGFPTHAIAYCLDEAGIDASDLEL